MKTLNKTLLALLATSAVSVGANAALYNSTGVAGQPYVGIKAGQSQVDIDGADKPTAYGIYGGYQFDPAWGAEVEYVGSNKADLKDGSTKVGTIESQTFGGYGTYKYGIPNTALYAKGKLGVAQSKLKVKDTLDNVNYKADASKTGVAGGLGLGYNLSPMVAVEAEYAFSPKVEDIKTDAWTIGAHMKF